MATNKTWNDEDSWWRDNFNSRPYATGRKYEDFRPAICTASRPASTTWVAIGTMWRPT